MTAGAHAIAYRRLRAPPEDRSGLIDPPLAEASALLAANVAARSEARCDFGGIPWAELARQAREELLREAVSYTSSYRDISGAVRCGIGGAGAPELGRRTPPVLLAGHQPQLFHAGVWLKNFALGLLARRHGAVAINLLIDSDTMKSHLVRVPGGSVSRPQVGLIPLDAPGPVLPYEQRRIFDQTTFAAFGRRAAEQIAPLIREPLVWSWWPTVLARAKEVDNLGAALAQARHQLEGSFGLDTLEVPQSRICRMRWFAWFSAWLLAQLPRLVAAYNQAVREYRRVYRIRSAAHPFPDLVVEGPWHEAPYWVWTEADPRRRRLFVCRKPGRLLLSDHQDLEVVVPLGEDLWPTAERLAELLSSGVRICSRALITTLFARLVLGDLFVHGIGGAKYDQVTDALIERFFGLRPPGCLIVSATLQLPVARPKVRVEELRAVARRLRELTWHPDKAAVQAAGIGRCEQLAELIASKRRWIETPQTPENARTRWLEFRRINQALQPWVASERQRLLRQQAQLAEALEAEKVLACREYAFCLFPESTLREFIAGLLPADR